MGEFVLPFGYLVRVLSTNFPLLRTHILTPTGLINNILYVIILSAALDLVGPLVPKSLVLLFDVLPSFIIKLLAPYVIHAISYPTRILIFVALSTTGMLMVALSPASAS